MRHIAMVLLTLAWIAPSAALADSLSHREAAAELVALTDAAKIDPAIAVAMFDILFQEKMKIAPYREVLHEWLESLSSEQMALQHIDLYVKEFTEEEIRELIAFYKTRTGRKTLEKAPLLFLEGMKIGMEVAKLQEAELKEMLEVRRREIEGTPGGTKEGPQPAAESLLQRANRLYDERSWAKARDAYIEYLRSNPADMNARADLGVCYKELGAYRKALEELDRVLAAKPEHWQALCNKIIVLGFDLGRRSEAKALLPKLRKISPDQAAVEKLAAALEED